jgi:hypothetical protein
VWFRAGQRARRKDRQRYRFFQRLEIEEVIDGEGVGQQPLQRSNIVLQLLIAQLDIGHAGLDIQALVFPLASAAWARS